MKDKDTYSFENLPKDKTDLEAIKKLTEHQITEAASADSDAPLLSQKQLQEFKRVYSPHDIKNIRDRLHISQSVFAAYFGVKLKTLQDWEQGRRKPEGPARILLAIIDKNPALVRKTLLDE